MKVKECTLDALVLEIYDPKNRIVYRNERSGHERDQRKKQPHARSPAGAQKTGCDVP